MRTILKLVSLLTLASLPFAVSIPVSHAQADEDYARYASEWRDLNYTIPQAASKITYAVDAASRAAGIAELEHIAMQGSALAAQQLALGYLNGAHGMPVDLSNSRRYYEMAVRQELAEALLDYGLLLLSGHRFEADAERGQAYVLRSAQLGNLAAKAFVIEQLVAAGDDASLARAEAWRQQLGVGFDPSGELIDDENFRQRLLSYGYAQIAQYFLDNVRVPADAEQAHLYASKIPIERRGAAAGQIARRYGASDWTGANHAQAKAIYLGELDALDAWDVNNYAWLMATSPDADVRDGELAVSVMETLLEKESREVAWVDTLAAAYAEAGDFDKAIQAQDEALAGFEQQTDRYTPTAYDEARRRRDGYVEGRAWRE